MVKDLKKPKGKMSSYAFFVQTSRQEHKRKNPEASVNFLEFSKKCSEQWKTLSASDKGKFEDKAKADKVRYDHEMQDYIPPKGMGKRGRKKDPNAPKRPPSAFFVFCGDFRPMVKSEYPGLTIGETAKKLGEMWGKQTPKERAPFDQKALKLREKYEKDMAAYRTGGAVGGGGGAKSASAGSFRKAEAEDDEDDDDDDEDDDDDDDE